MTWKFGPAAFFIAAAFTGANAAEFNYSLERNITKFNNDDPSASAFVQMSERYGSVSVKDVDGGVDILLSVENRFDGFLRHMHFNTIAELPLLTSVTRKDWYETVSGPYFESTNDSINGYGLSYTSFTVWEPSSIVFAPFNSHNEDATFEIQLRQLPETVTAEDWIPKYAELGRVTGLPRFYESDSYILATPVPEPASVALMFVGVAALAFVRRRA